MSFKLVWENRTAAGKRSFSQAWTSGAKAYLRGYHAGHAYFESLKTRNRTVAAKRFAARQKEIVDGAEALEDNAVINFAAAVKLYFGTGNPEELDPTGRVARIFDKFAERRLSSITQAELDALARELHPKAGPKTLNREVYTPFVAVYNAAAGQKKVVERRWRRPKGAHKRVPVNPPTDDRIRLIGEAATSVPSRSAWEIARNEAAIYTFSLTGDRTGALVQLRWPDIDFKAGTIFFRATKNGEPRTVLMPPLLREALERLRALKAPSRHRRYRAPAKSKKDKQPDDLVFGWETRFGPARMIARARKKAGAGAVRPHDLGRHAFGRRVRRTLKMDRAELMKVGNWKSEKAAAVYDHLEVNELMERVRDVDTTDLAITRTSNKSRNKP